MSKGSEPRPLSVTKKQFDENWDRIFGPKGKPAAPSVDDVQRSRRSPALLPFIPLEHPTPATVDTVVRLSTGGSEGSGT